MAYAQEVIFAHADGGKETFLWRTVHVIWYTGNINMEIHFSTKAKAKGQGITYIILYAKDSV